MTDQTPQAPQDPNTPRPGWYPDYADQTLLRWWDGRGWTAHAMPMPGTGSRQPWPQQAAMPFQVNQHASFPSSSVTRQPLGILETCFHAFMTLMSCGLWAPVWYGRVRMHKSYTTFR